jgi:hypothetical protein
VIANSLTPTPNQPKRVGLRMTPMSGLGRCYRKSPNCFVLIFLRTTKWATIARREADREKSGMK